MSDKVPIIAKTHNVYKCTYLHTAPASAHVVMAQGSLGHLPFMLGYLALHFSFSSSNDCTTERGPMKGQKTSVSTSTINSISFTLLVLTTVDIAKYTRIHI